MDRSVASLETVISGPKLTTQSGNLLGRVLDDAPAEIGFVGINFVEEIVRKHSFLASDKVKLFLVLNFSEVNPASQAECLVARKSTESLIALYLVKRSVFKRTARHCETSAVDFAHCRCEPVQFSQVLWWQDDTSSSVNNTRSFIWLNQHSVELTRKEASQVNQLFCLIRLDTGRQRCESVVLRRAPEEVLLRQASFHWLCWILHHKLLSQRVDHKVVHCGSCKVTWTGVTTYFDLNFHKWRWRLALLITFSSQTIKIGTWLECQHIRQKLNTNMELERIWLSWESQEWIFTNPTEVVATKDVGNRSPTLKNSPACDMWELKVTLLTSNFTPEVDVALVDISLKLHASKIDLTTLLQVDCNSVDFNVL